MSDFIREVDEEYRRDRAAQFLSRYKVLIAVLVVAVVAAAGTWRFWSDRDVSRAKAANTRYEAAVTLADEGKDAEARAAFDAIAEKAPSGYALLARMRTVEALSIHDPDGAAKAFDAIAGDESISAAMRDLARLRGAFLRADHEDPQAFEQRYGRFSVAGFPYHASMRELLALVAIKRGDIATATRYLDQILEDSLAPTALRNRAEAFRTLALAGPAAVSAAAAGQPSVATLPPSPALDTQSATPPAAPASPVPSVSALVPSSPPASAAAGSEPPAAASQPDQ